jgi:hypothetical protein
VIKSVLLSLNDLPDELRFNIERLTKRIVKVPGFRNSTKAPVGVRIKPTVDAFEKDPDLTAAILAAWAENHNSLRQNVYDLLNSRGWELLPPDADRTKLPGFLTKWPKDENFEILNDAYKTMYLGEQTNDDDISLMVVWLSGRLPYEMQAKEEYY